MVGEPFFTSEIGLAVDFELEDDVESCGGDIAERSAIS